MADVNGKTPTKLSRQQSDYLRDKFAEFSKLRWDINVPKQVMPKEIAKAKAQFEKWEQESRAKDKRASATRFKAYEKQRDKIRREIAFGSPAKALAMLDEAIQRKW